jgi:hypothetical protein
VARRRARTREEHPLAGAELDPDRGAGLVAPTGLAVGNGLIYISNYGIYPGTGPGPH